MTDLVVIDIITLKRHVFSLSPSSDISPIYVALSSYFPFDTQVFGFIDKMEPSEFALGVGYPRKNNANIINDIQIGLTGGVEFGELIDLAAHRELGEETGLDLGSLHVHSTSNHKRQGKNWTSYFLSLLPASRLLETLTKSRPRPRSRQSVCMMVKGEQAKFEAMYSGISPAQHIRLVLNKDGIRYIAFMSKNLLMNSRLILGTGCGTHHIPPLYLQSVNQRKAGDYVGMLLGHWWERTHIKQKFYQQQLLRG